VSVDRVKKIKLINYDFPKKALAASEESSGFSSTPAVEDRSTNIRFNVEWPRAIRALAKNPLLGTGYSSITLATDNDYLRLLGEVGLLGFFAFFLIFLRIGALYLDTLPLYRRFSGIELAFIAGAIGALPGLFANAVFIDIFEASKFAITFWLITGISLGLVNKHKSI
jgi:O-antigen ligase